LDAADAALSDVVFFGAAVWLKVLPAAALDEGPVALPVRVLDAFEAAFCQLPLVSCCPPISF
jgi:hypothetical protein